MVFNVDNSFMAVVWHFGRHSNIMRCTILQICKINNFLKFHVTHVWDLPFVHKRLNNAQPQTFLILRYIRGCCAIAIW
jgi:hypothetical protein